MMSGKSLHGGGGAERRFLRIFEKARKEGNQNLRLIINRSLLESAISLGLVTMDEKIEIIEDRRVCNSLCFSLRVLRFVKLSKTNIIHFVLIRRSLVPLYVILLLCKPVRKTMIITTVASYLYAYEIELSISERFVYWLIRRCSERLDVLYMNTKLQSPKISVTPCSFTNYESFFPSEHKEDLVVFSGRLAAEKNPLLFLRAIDELINKRQNQGAKRWRYILFGDGPLKHDVLDFIEKKGLSDYVTVKQGDTTLTMRQSRIFVSLQTHENYPSQSLLEAIATENVVIATDVGDTRRLVNESSGFLVDLDVASVANALEAAFTQDNHLAQMAQRSRETIRKNHNIGRFYDYLLDLWGGRL